MSMSLRNVPLGCLRGWYLEDVPRRLYLEDVPRRLYLEAVTLEMRVYMLPV